MTYGCTHAKARRPTFAQRPESSPRVRQSQNISSARTMGAPRLNMREQPEIWIQKHRLTRLVMKLVADTLARAGSSGHLECLPRRPARRRAATIRAAMSAASRTTPIKIKVLCSVVRWCGRPTTALTKSSISSPGSPIPARRPTNSLPGTGFGSENLEFSGASRHQRTTVPLRLVRADVPDLAGRPDRLV